MTVLEPAILYLRWLFSFEPIALLARWSSGGGKRKGGLYFEATHSHFHPGFRGKFAGLLKPYYLNFYIFKSSTSSSSAELEDCGLGSFCFVSSDFWF